MEILGWFFCLFVSVGFLIAPILVIALSGLGGGMRWWEKIWMATWFAIGLTGIFYCTKYAPLTITLN